jgi:hypothetical protein
MVTMSRSLIDAKNDLWFGFRGEDLSFTQKKRAMDFDEYLTEWMLDNVGAYGEEWWAELDKEKDSLRAVFRDPSMESWVLLKWCDNAD